MTQKERLVALINEAQIECDDNYGMTHSGQMADFLLDNGVILPPVRVGDTVHTNSSMRGWYYRAKNRPYSAKVVFIGINGGNGFFNVAFEDGNMLQFNFSDLGRTVFLSREEAAAALDKTDLSAGFRKMG